jgi:hypothetical protein
MSNPLKTRTWYGRQVYNKNRVIGAIALGLALVGIGTVTYVAATDPEAIAARKAVEANLARANAAAIALKAEAAAEAAAAAEKAANEAVTAAAKAKADKEAAKATKAAQQAAV